MYRSSEPYGGYLRLCCAEHLVTSSEANSACQPLDSGASFPYVDTDLSSWEANRFAGTGSISCRCPFLCWSFSVLAACASTLIPVLNSDRSETRLCGPCYASAPWGTDSSCCRCPCLCQYFSVLADAMYWSAESSSVWNSHAVLFGAQVLVGALALGW